MEKETIEEVLPKNNNGKYSRNEIEKSFEEGAKWRAEQDKDKYSEEEVVKLLISCKDRFGGSDLDDYVEDSKVIKWFEQIKKK